MKRKFWLVACTLVLLLSLSFGVSLPLFAIAETSSSNEYVLFDGDCSGYTYYEGTNKPDSHDYNFGRIPTVNAGVNGNGSSLDFSRSGNNFFYELNNTYDVTQLSAPVIEIWFYFDLGDRWESYWAQETTEGDHDLEFGLISTESESFNYESLWGSYRYDFKGLKEKIANGAWTKLVLPVYKDQTWTTDFKYNGEYTIHGLGVDLTKIDCIGYFNFGPISPTVYFSSVKVFDANDYESIAMGIVEQKNAVTIGVSAGEHGTAKQTVAAAGSTAAVEVRPELGYTLESATINGDTDDAPVLTRKPYGQGLFYTFTAPDNDSTINFTFRKFNASETKTQNVAFPVEYSSQQTNSAPLSSPEGLSKQAIYMGAHSSDNFETYLSYNANFNPKNGADVYGYENLTFAFCFYLKEATPIKSFEIKFFSDFIRTNATNQNGAYGIIDTENGNMHGKWDCNISGVQLSTGWNLIYVPLSIGSAGVNGFNFTNLTSIKIVYQSQTSYSDTTQVGICSPVFMSSDYTQVTATAWNASGVVDYTIDPVQHGAVSVSPSIPGDAVSVKLTPDLGYRALSCTVSYADGETVSLDLNTAVTGDKSNEKVIAFNAKGDFAVTVEFEPIPNAPETADVTFSGALWGEYQPNVTLPACLESGSVSALQVFNGHGSKDNHGVYYLATTDFTGADVNAFAFNVYISDKNALQSTVFLRFHSNLTAEELLGGVDLNVHVQTYGVAWELNTSDLRNGWNALTLPFSAADCRDGFDWGEVTMMQIVFLANNSQQSIVAIDHLRMVKTDATSIENADYNMSFGIGASVRTNPESMGIRFEVYFTAEMYAKVASGEYVAGMIIVPAKAIENVTSDYFTALLNTYNKTESDVSTTFSLAQFKQEEVGGKTVYSARAAIVNLKDENLTYAYQAVAWCKTQDGVYMFSDKSDVRSISEVTNKALLSDLDAATRKAVLSMATALSAKLETLNQSAESDFVLTADKANGIDLSKYQSEEKTIENVTLNESTVEVEEGKIALTGVEGDYASLKIVYADGSSLILNVTIS